MRDVTDFSPFAYDALSRLPTAFLLTDGRVLDRGGKWKLERQVVLHGQDDGSAVPVDGGLEAPRQARARRRAHRAVRRSFGQ
jgi:hypothetical protein